MTLGTANQALTTVKAATVTSTELTGTTGTNSITSPTKAYFTAQNNGVAATYMLGSYNGSGAVPGIDTSKKSGSGLGGIDAFPRLQPVTNSTGGTVSKTSIDQAVMQTSDFFSTDQGSSPVKFNINSARIDIPNIVVNSSKGNISSLFNDAQNLSNQDSTTSRNILEPLLRSTPIGIAAANQSPITNYTSSQYYNPDNNALTYPDFTQVKAFNVDNLNKKISVEFEGYYNGKTAKSWADVVKADVKLTMTMLQDGSVRVDESLRNDSNVDLNNVYFVRQYNTYVGNLASTQHTGATSPNGPDTVGFHYLGNNHGLYLDGNDATSSTNDAAGLRINYQFDINNGPTGWIANYANTVPDPNSGTISAVFGKNAQADNPTGNALNNTGDYHPTASASQLMNGGSYSIGKMAPKGNGPSGNIPDSGISMKWGPYTTWQNGQTLNTSYIYGIGNSYAPILTLNSPKPGSNTTVNTGKAIPVDASVIDDDAGDKGGHETMYYSVDDGSKKGGTQLSGVQNSVAKPFNGSIPASDLPDDKAHVVKIWVVDDDGNISNIEQFTVSLGLKMGDPAGFTLYDSLQNRGANSQIDSTNFNPGWIGNNNSGTDFFTIKSPSTDGTPFPAVGTTGQKMYLSVFDSSGKEVLKDSNDNIPGQIFNRSGTVIKNADGTTSLTAKDGQYDQSKFINSSDGTKNLDPQKKYTFNYGWISGGDEDSGPFKSTVDTRPFVIIAPKVTIDQSQTHVYDSGTQANIHGTNQIVGNNGVVQEDDSHELTGPTIYQPGDKVYVFRDQEQKGIYGNGDANDDQKYDENPANAIAKTTVDSSGNFKLDLSGVKLTAGEELWVVETNGSGGTSGTARTSDVGTADNPDGTYLTAGYNGHNFSGAGAKGVKVASTYGFESVPQWDFGTNQKYAMGQVNSYNLKTTTGTNEVKFYDNLKNVVLNSSFSSLTDTKDSTSQISDDSLKLANRELDDGNNNSVVTNSSDATVLPNQFTNLINSTNSSDNSEWSLKFGKDNTDGSNDSVNLITNGSKSVKSGDQYKGTVTWQLTNSIS